jgi:hypothetical protein
MRISLACEIPTLALKSPNNIFMAVAKVTSKYKSGLVGAQEVRWDRGGNEPAGQYTFFFRKGNENHELGTASLYVRKSYR